MLSKIAPSACLDGYKPMRPIIYRAGFARWLPVFFILAVALGGCSLVPDYERPEPLIPGLANAADQTLEAIEYSDFLSQEEVVVLDSLDASGELKRLAVSALAHNSDYQIAMFRVEEARAEYGIAKADRMPSIQATGQMQRQSFNDRTLNEVYGQHHSAVTIGVSDYELDFFGRVRALSDASRHSYFASVLGQQAARKALLLEVAQRYLAMRAVMERDRLASTLLQHREQQLLIALHAHGAGGISEDELRDINTLAVQARQQVDEQANQLSRVRNSLERETGYSVSVIQVRPGPIDLVEIPWLANLSSEQLLQRYDVLTAEEQLKAANASIGAARAAFFPSIKLSTAAGVASGHLGDLFSQGTGTWLFVPQITLPIFDGGRNQANLDLAQARKNISVANYERTIQNAFQDMVDGLKERKTLLQRVSSQSELNGLAQALAERRQRQFARGDISQLEATAALVQAVQTEQVLTQTRLAIQINLLSLYRTLYGADASAISS